MVFTKTDSFFLKIFARFIENQKFNFMKTKTKLLIILLLSINFASAQCPDPPVIEAMTGNAVEAMISNGGDLFFDGTRGFFQVPVEIDPHRTTIYAAALWMGGYDEGQNLKLSAQTYGRNYDEFDYTSGPLKPETGEPYADNCENFNRVWKVEKQEVLDHIADFEDNGVIDNPIASVYAWPGHNSVQCYYYNGFILPYSPQKWAPFYDKNNNGNYDPEEGDYPHPPNVIPNLIPEQISWTVFNDNIVHQQSEGVPLKVEVQLTSWNFNCLGNHVLKHSLFTSHKIINRSQENIDSMYIGLWVDFDNGCPTDDFLGCSPENNGFFVYNSDALDGESSPTDCFGLPTYGYNPPAQSVVFLNQKLDKFIFHNPFPGCVGPPGEQYPPSSPIEYYNYLRGRWNDGTPLTYGGSGYQVSGGTPTNWAFPDNPNDSSGWSMYAIGAANGDRRVVGSTFEERLEPGEIFRLDMAHTYHGYSTLDNLESANQAYIEMPEVQQMYDMRFNGWCNNIVAGTEELFENQIKVFPNPNNGSFYIKTDNKEIGLIEVYDQLGKFIKTIDFRNHSNGQINLIDQPSGIYVLKISSKENTFVEKVLKR